MSTTKLQSSTTSRAGFVNRFLSIYDDEDATVENYSLDADDSAISLQTDHYSEVSKVISNKYKVSEMINPDGSVTVRNLLIQEDGTWIRKQEEIDDNGQNHNLYGLTSSRRDIINQYGCNEFTSSDIPSLKQANSFESSNSLSSHSDHNDLSEGAAANRLRRQRLAQTQLLTTNPSFDTASEGSYRCFQNVQHQEKIRLSSIMHAEGTPPRSFQPSFDTASEGSYRCFKNIQHQEKKKLPSLFAGGTPPRSFQPSNQSQTKMFLTTNPFIPHRPTRARSNIGNTVKHVAFSEPVESVVSEIGDDDRNFTRFHAVEQKISSRSCSGEESSIFQDVTTPYKNNYLDEILGQLQDTKVNHNSSPDISNVISYLDEDHCDYAPHIHSVTVYKKSQSDKIGIYVGLEKFDFGNRLVISLIAPNGKFADSGIEVGDIVISINSESMVEDPSPQRASDIVTAATNRVTIVMQKKFEMDDYQSATETSISSMTKGISSFVYDKNQPNSFKRNMSSTSASIEGTETINDSLDTSKEGNESSEATFNKLSRREKMIGDGLLVSENSEITEPVSILINESWKLSGAIVVNVKEMNHSDEPGLRMGIKETSNGRVLFVSDIIPSSPFAKTPLRIGDIILSINNVSLHENVDVVNAYAALGKSGNRITVVAKKGQESLNDFLLDGRREPVIQKDEIILNDRKIISTPSSTGTAGTAGTTKSGTTTISSQDEATFNISNFKEKNKIRQEQVGNSPQSVKNTIPFHPSSKTDQLEFDEESYGASLYGYNSSSSIRIVKNASSTEDVGFEIREVNTEWGRLLTVAKITPLSLVSTTHLKVGDAILAINDVDFRKNPDVERAASLLKISHGEVCIEYQKISRYLSAVPVDSYEQKEVPMKNKDLASVGNSSELISRSGQVAMPILEEAEVNGKSLSMKSSITNDQQRGREVHSMERGSKGQENSNRQRQHLMKVKRQKIWITVTRGKGQKVGINLATLNGKLVVTKVSSSGLLRNAPLMTGDTILSINRVDFRLNPNAKEASLLVNDAPKHITFEILKTGYDSNDKSDGVGTKTCVLGSFLCVTGRRRRVNHSHPPSTKLDEKKEHKTGYDTPL